MKVKIDFLPEFMRLDIISYQGNEEIIRLSKNNVHM